MHPIEHIFWLGSGGTGKSHWIKTICQAVSERFLDYGGDPDQWCVLLLGQTWISAVNKGGTTVNSALEIKPGIKLMALGDKAKAILRIKL